MTRTVNAILGPGGLLANVIGPHYEARGPQLTMAAAVQRAVLTHTPLVVEAGTGTGKSWSYLVGGVAADARIVISTSSKALQGQLLTKDLPLLARALGQLDFVAAKGKQNYLCLQKVKGRYGLFGTYAWPAEVAAGAMTHWAESTTTGDLDEVPTTLSPRASSQIAASESCLGQHCQFYPQCWYYGNKARWPQADVLVTNHALLLIELTRPVGLLNATHRPLLLVCDEAHQLASYAVNALSAEVSRHALRYGDNLDPQVEKLSAIFFQAVVTRYAQAGSDEAIPAEHAIEEGYALTLALRDRASAYWPSSQPPKNLSAAENYAVATRLRGLADRVKAVSAPTETGHVRHVQQMPSWQGDLTETSVIAATAWDVAGLLAELPSRATSTVYCSATLGTSAGPAGLSFFEHTVGLSCHKDQPTELIVGSPFDYPRQGLLYLPPASAMPAHPNAANFNHAVSNQLLPLLTASHGRALCLFTSYSALRAVVGELRPRLPHLKFLEQGAELSRDALLTEFRAAQGRQLVLCATKSFWEGVSLEGAQLGLVTIDRMPFTPPGPIQSAKQAAIEARGGNWFSNLALPEAVAALRQGVGRLIRTTTDRGVVAVFDPRLTQKPWGRTVLNALPPFRRTQNIQEVSDFFKQQS